MSQDRLRDLALSIKRDEADKTVFDGNHRRFCFDKDTESFVLSNMLFKQEKAATLMFR